MSNLLHLFSEVCGEVADYLRGKQRREEQQTVLGESEFEKEGPGFAWAIILGLIGLMVAGGIYFL